MIVLDEQLMGRGIEVAIARWHPGRVCFVNDLRPGTVIKDDAIPRLLARFEDAVFVTINVTDFWRRSTATKGTCIVCVDIPDSRARDVPALLRRFMAHDMFRTSRLRRGIVARISHSSASCYDNSSAEIREIAPFV